MSRFLAVDVGAGTMDILYFDSASGLHYKAVVKSPVQSLAEQAEALKGHLLVTGVEMGGGPLSQVLKKRAQQAEVVMSRSASATVHHDLERVQSFGIKVVEDGEAEKLTTDRKYNHLAVADLGIRRLKSIIEGFGVSFAFDAVCVCAQDHGVAPKGISHLDYRHQIFEEELRRNPFPHHLLYRQDGIPKTFNRLKALAQCAAELPTEAVYVMDSGMAAVLGASLDSRARSKRRLLVLDIATSHTVGAAMEDGEIAGFFEYHTQDITLDRLEKLLVGLADGELEHKRILEEGGHGAYIRRHFGFANAEILVATGPKRGLIQGSTLSFTLGSPLGDNMMTGTAGLLEALYRGRGLGEMPML